jgi:Ca-activated chloride channel family protein
MSKNGMNDDTDKLATQMQNLSPSRTSRESGMRAAMAAFDKEFAAETVSAKTADSEKISDGSQGLADAPRPTGTPTKTVQVKTRRVETMQKRKPIFNFKPHSMMMAGTCAAALMAAMIVLPNMDELGLERVVVTSEDNKPIISESAGSEITDAPDVIDAPTQAPTPELVEPAIDVVKPPTSQEGRLAAVDQTPSNIVTIERRVLKAPGRVEAVNVPAQYGTIERRTQISPERAEWVKTGVDPKTGGDLYAREIVPAEYESKPEQVILRQAGEELRVIPPLYETVKETIQINADGTTEVLSSEVQPWTTTKPTNPVVHDEIVVTAGKSPASLPKGGITSVDSLLSDVRGNKSKAQAGTQPREQRFQQAAPSRPTSPPAPQLGGLDGAISSAQGNPRAALSRPRNGGSPSGGFTAAPAPSTETDKIAGLTLEVVPGSAGNAGKVNTSTQGQFTVFNGTSNVVVQSTETIVSQTGEILCRVMIPAKYKTITKQVVKSPARAEKRVVPAVTKDVTVKVKLDDGSFEEVTKTFVIEDAKTEFVVIPAKYETRSERVLVEPAREEWKPGSQALNANTIVQKPIPPKYILRDDDGAIVREFENRDAFEIYKANLPTPVAEKPVSTFSVDVDTSSYTFLRASINRGQLPPRSAIRLEEMINYFPYDYDAPKSADEPFKANVTVTPNPWNTDTKLMHIGIKGYVPKETEKPRSNLVFLIDTSGSMRSANKLPLLINSFKLLLNTLDEDDTVSIVAYASASGTVLEPTKVRNKSEILAALNNLRAGGSTAGAAGLELAYQKAQESFDDEGVNRVILATDGDFNVGFSSPDDMKSFIQKKRETGIFLSVLGFGMGNYNDHLMQSLAQNGNGVAAYIDSLAEANKVLANEAGGALFTIAKDVKIQVEFNPAKIAEYRLIGYETRALKRQDFNNDKVDAGEIGAGHSVTAIYEMTPVGSPAVTVDKLRYAADTGGANTGSDEYAFVKIRHKLPDADKSTLQTFPIGKRQESSLKRASDDMRFATAVAAVGQKVRGDTAVEDYSYQDALKLAKAAKGKDENGYRAEFIQLIQLIESLDGASLEIPSQKIGERRR